MFGRGLFNMSPDIFEMAKKTRTRKVVFDITYKWIPFVFVVFVVIVCTALLSTSGKPSYGIVVAFCITAGHLVFLFLLCHLVLYCTGIKHQMNLEKANGDNSTADSSPQPDKTVSSNSSANANNINTTIQEQQAAHDQPPHQNLGREGHHQSSQDDRNHQMGRKLPNRNPAAQPGVHRLNQAADYGPVQPKIRREAGIGVRQQFPPPVFPQGPRESVLRRSSATPSPLRVRRPAPQVQSDQHRPPAEQASDTPSRPPHSQHMSGRDGMLLHSARTTMSQVEPAELPSHEPTPRRGTAPRDAVPQQTPQSSSSHQRQGGLGIAYVGPRDELFLPAFQDSLRGLSARITTSRDQAGPQDRAAEAPNSVQARFAFVGGPDVLDLLSTLLSEMKPPTHLSGVLPEDCFERPPSVPADVAAVNFQNTERKPVQLRPATPAVERIRSQKARVQKMTGRGPGDSGYYTADSTQHPPSLPQTRDASTAVSSPSSNSSRPSFLPSSGTESAQHSSHPGSSVSSMGSEWMDMYERAGWGDESAIRFITGRPRDKIPRLRGRSRTY
ncbi:hypothetical protein J7T55_003560 [Diaporthe amygdali]|uniref:uncharacterized protein n=1 Tax=Phomopsis amygdali TaxID=1214568 RepID=UPI0022FE3547|nr:uncharacterized protein J7T55_003560 [Diaporthe amygdali]KAJ0117143.1 hypothetical protein J7T55_003560 [Diaporthe amygdali]